MGDAIPVLGTAIVNGPHWLHRLFSSIDYPVDNFVVFNNNGRGQITKAVDALRDIANPHVKNVHIVHMPGNMGCAGAWNLIIKSFVMAPYWVITNHDVMFLPGFLAEMVAKSRDPNIGMVHGWDGGWDVFLLKDDVVRKCGLFDENTYPAYCEDADYTVRVNHLNIQRVMTVGVDYYHGNAINDYSDASKTVHEAAKAHEDELVNKINYAHAANKQYMHKKWNEAWQKHIDGACYPTPFNSGGPIDFMQYNLDFIRHKHLGF